MKKGHKIEGAGVCYARVTPNLCTQSVQHSFKVHSVSVYFSAVRKIEKKGVKHRTFILLKCSFSCLHLQYVWVRQKVSECDECIYKNNIKTPVSEHIDTLVKIKL